MDRAASNRVRSRVGTFILAVVLALWITVRSLYIHRDPMCAHKLWILSEALNVWAEKHSGLYPRSLNELMGQDRILDRVPICGDGVPYDKGYHVSKDFKGYRLYCPRASMSKALFLSNSYLEFDNTSSISKVR